MDLRDGHFVCLFFLVLSTAYLYHSILVLHDELEYKSSIIDTLKQIQDAIVREQEQQKFKLVDLRTQISINRDDNLELRENVLSNNNNIKTFDETFVDLRRFFFSLQNKVESIEVNFKALEKDKFQTERTILQMLTENSRDLTNLFTRLRSDHNGVKDDLEKIKKQLKETFAKTFQEIEEAYTVSENILQRINKLEVNENRRQDSGVLWMIKEGINRLAQLAWNFFLGRITGYLE